MATACETSSRDEVKSQFNTREGQYRVMTFSEYRPNRGGCVAQSNHPVRVSFVTLPCEAGAANGAGAAANSDRICFNVGRELYFYVYKGLRKAADLTKPMDKRVYKGTYPTCHDFNEFTVSSNSVSLLVGFSAGQIQLIDPIKKELSKLYNEERLIDKSKVTCLKWLPASPNQFLVAHSSGQMYVYNEELPCGTTPPHYQLFKQGDGFAVYTCKTKSTRNPLYRWVIGEGSLNEFAFSPCCRYLATVSQDGFLRVFGYDTMDLLGVARSYFGGLLCVCWSPDGRYVVSGGEDDLVTVWSFAERRVVARGHGHKSWVSVVAFDAFTTQPPTPHNSHSHATHLTDCRRGGDCSDDDDLVLHVSGGSSGCGDLAGSGGDTPALGSPTQPQANCTRLNSVTSPRSPPPPPLSAATSNTTVPTSPQQQQPSSGGSGGGGGGSLACYRFGSVSQDTQLCLWDLTEDVLRQPPGRSRTSLLLGTQLGSHLGANSTRSTNNSSGASAHHSTGELNSSSFTSHSLPNCLSNKEPGTDGAAANGPTSAPAVPASLMSTAPLRDGLTHKFATLSLGGDRKERREQQQSGGGEQPREHKRNFSLASRNSDKNSLIKSGQHAGGKGGSLPDDPLRIGTVTCPRLDEVPLLEPLVCKKIAHERLTALAFREDCIVTACQEGFVCTWARPGRAAPGKDCVEDGGPYGTPNLT